MKLDADETQVLRVLVGQFRELIADDEPPDERTAAPELAELGLPRLGEQVERPTDPVLMRLFPDAYRDDPKAASDFRRYTQSELRSGKQRCAETILATLPSPRGGTVSLDDEQVGAWLRGLNDLRLALGTRLEVTEDAHEEFARMSRDDPRFAAFATYDWLSFLQDSLIRAL